MGVNYNLARIPRGASQEQANNIYNETMDELEHRLSFLQSVNIKEVAGWLASLTELKSKDGSVGMSSKETDGDDVRYWAGNVNPEIAPFQVRKSGKGTMSGINIKSRDTYPNIELSSDEDLLRASASASSYIEIEALSEFDNTAIKLVNGSTLGYIQAALGAIHLLTASGDIIINPSGTVYLFGNEVVVSSWSSVRSVASDENETLRDVFDYYDTMISYLTSSIGILSSRISALEGA